MLPLRLVVVVVLIGFIILVIIFSSISIIIGLRGNILKALHLTCLVISIQFNWLEMNVKTINILSHGQSPLLCVIITEEIGKIHVQQILSIEVCRGTCITSGAKWAPPEPSPVIWISTIDK